MPSTLVSFRESKSSHIEISPEISMNFAISILTILSCLFVGLKANAVEVVWNSLEQFIHFVPCVEHFMCQISYIKRNILHSGMLTEIIGSNESIWAAWKDEVLTKIKKYYTYISKYSSHQFKVFGPWVDNESDSTEESETKWSSVHLRTFNVAMIVWKIAKEMFWTNWKIHLKMLTHWYCGKRNLEIYGHRKMSKIFPKLYWKLIWIWDIQRPMIRHLSMSVLIIWLIS